MSYNEELQKNNQDLAEILKAVNELPKAGGGIEQETDPTVPEWAKQPQKPTYTAEEVGAQPKGDYVLRDELPEIPEVPETLPNPNKLTFKGAVTAEYDGSQPVEVEIPEIPEIPESIPIPETAEVGQTIVVKAVDENGKPTEWESADLPSGEIPLIAEVTLTEEVSTITIDTDNNGKPLNVSEMYLYVGPVGGSPNENASPIVCYFNKQNTAVQRFDLGGNNGLLPKAGGGWSGHSGFVYHFQKLKYGFVNNIDAWVKFLNSAENTKGDALTFTAVSLFCKTTGYTFGVGTKIRIYGR